MQRADRLFLAFPFPVVVMDQFQGGVLPARSRPRVTKSTSIRFVRKRPVARIARRQEPSHSRFIRIVAWLTGCAEFEAPARKCYDR